MFHRNRHQEAHEEAIAREQHAQRQGFFSRFRGHQRPVPAYNVAETNRTYGPQSGYGTRQYYRDPYYEGSTRSDWDHYAVRHEEALIGDPVPIMNNNLNLANHHAWNGQNAAHGPYGNGPLSNGPVNHGYDDAHYNKRHPVHNGLDKHGNPLVGPVTANGPLPGNYSSGTVVEKNFVRGVGKGRTQTGFIDDPAYGGRQWQSAAWGGEPLFGGPSGQSLYGNHPGGGAWGSTPLYGYRDGREYGRATPLLPDNPWTHNELGRDWEDGYRRGTIPYSSINNAFTQPSTTESFVEYGPNGERIEGYRTRTVREDIVPPTRALGQTTESSTTKKVTDVVTPVVEVVPVVPVVAASRSATTVPASAVAIPLGGGTGAVEVIEVSPVGTTATVVKPTL